MSGDTAKTGNTEQSEGKSAGFDTSLRAEPFDEVLDTKLLFASPDCVKIIGLDGKVRQINEAGRLMMELDEGAGAVGAPLASLFPEDVRAMVDAAICDAATGKVARFVSFRPMAHSTPKWWDVVVSPVHDKDGKVVCLMSVSRDITRHKTTEEALRFEEQRLRALADNIAPLAWMADASGSMFWYNKRWYDYTGITRADVSSDGWKQMVHPDHLPRVVEKYHAGVSAGEGIEDTFPLRRADGEYRWFLSRARPIQDDSGKVVLWCGTNTDITEQRNASARLRQLARLIELSHEAMIVWDRDEGILLWNRGCEELYGYSQAEALGTSSHKLLQTEHSMSVEAFETILVRDGAWNGEFLHTSKGGGKVWVDSRQELIRIGGRDVVLETNRDITDRRKADRVRDLLVAELNHRVKNTLAIVQSIAAQTARTTCSREQFVDRLSDRLQALSGAHNILTDAHWAGASLRDLIASQLAVIVVCKNKIECSGPDVYLQPQAALQLTLMFHELATNALRYGALSTPTGKVQVSWCVDRVNVHKLELTWREIGGPLVVPPLARGFGMTLIERSGNASHLKTELTFEPTGVVCRIEAELSETVQEELAYFNPGKHLQDFSPAAPSLCQIRRRLANGLCVLIVEEDPLIGMEIDELLADGGFHSARRVCSVNAAMSALAQSAADVVIVDQTCGNRFDAVVAELQVRGVPLIYVVGNCLPDKNSIACRNDVPLLTKPIDASLLMNTLNAVMSKAGRSEGY